MNNGLRLIALVAAATIVSATPAGADATKDLRAVRGTSGYRTSSTAPFTRVVGRIALNDDAFAVTQVASNALVVLPDSSEVALGQNTNVQIGAFNDATAATPTTVTLQNGALRFAVRHPAGAPSNYRFQTVTSQIAVRGTIGLYATGPNGDVVSCLQCDPGDVVVTVGTQTYTLVTGQTLTISLAGLVSTVAGQATVAQTFAGTGLTTDAAAATAFTPTIGAAATAAVPASVYPIAAGVVGAGAAAAAISNSTHSTSPVNTIGPIPMVTPTPSAGTGNATLNGHARRP